MGSQDWASGNWVVTDGNQQAFMARWTEFLEWTKTTAPGFAWAVLIRDDEDPRHFVSFARWEDVDSLLSWRALPEFSAKLGACRQLCDEFNGSNYVEAIRVE